MKIVILILLMTFSLTTQAKIYRCKVNGKYITQKEQCHYVCNIQGKKLYSEKPCSKGMEYQNNEIVKNRELEIKKNARAINEINSVDLNHKKQDSDYFYWKNGQLIRKR